MEEIEYIEIEDIENMKKEFSELWGDIIIKIGDFKEEKIIEDMGMEKKLEMIGIFEGRGIGERLRMKKGEGKKRIKI